MLSIEILLDGLHELVILNRSDDERLSAIRGTLMYDRNTLTSLQKDYIYICNLEDMPGLESIYRDNILVFCAAANTQMSADHQVFPWCSRLVILNLSSGALLNALTLKINEYNDWLKALHSTEDIQRITEIATARFHFPAAVLNSFFFPSAIAFGAEPKSAIFKTLSNNERISSQQAAPILNTEREYFNISSFALYDEAVKITDYPIRYNNRVIARIFVEEQSEGSATAKYYVEDYINTIRPFLEAKDSLKKSSMNAVSTLIADIINRVLTDSDEIEERRKMLPDMVRFKYYHPVVIKFSNPGREIPYNYISGQLEMIFPKCSVATYNSGLIVIVPKDNPREQISFDYDHFFELLVKFDAYAGIGNSTMFLTALRPLYIEAAATARLGQVFCEDKNKRIFYYEDYCMYFYVDMCIEAAALHHSIGNISYLCEPGLIRLLQYDRKQSTSLFETLKTYIDCNCNASLCAQKLYSYRNTINKRINLIEDVIGAPLRNSNLIQKLSFSIKIIEYEMKYLKCDPIDASGKISINVDWNSYISFSEKPYY